MPFVYQILPEQNLFIHRLIGKFNQEELLKYFNKLSSTPEWKCVHKSLIDLTEGQIEVNNVKEIEGLIAGLSNFRKHVVNPVTPDNYFEVLLVKQPIMTALVHLYHDKIDPEDIEFQYCSSFSRAAELLKLEMDGKSLAKIAQSIKIHA